MTITGQGWELLVERLRVDRRGSRQRTVGRYRVFHEGRAILSLSGSTAECRGPGDNAIAGNRRRIEAGRYPLASWGGERYVTLGHRTEPGPRLLPRPGLELRDTHNRTEILIHPGRSFVWSTGCINLCGPLADASAQIDYADSRARVIALIDDLRAWAGTGFPDQNDQPIPRANVVVEGEP